MDTFCLKVFFSSFLKKKKKIIETDVIIKDINMNMIP